MKYKDSIVIIVYLLIIVLMISFVVWKGLDNRTIIEEIVQEHNGEIIEITSKTFSFQFKSELGWNDKNTWLYYFTWTKNGIEYKGVAQFRFFSKKFIMDLDNPEIIKK